MGDLSGSSLSGSDLADAGSTSDDQSRRNDEIDGSTPSDENDKPAMNGAQTRHGVDFDRTLHAVEDLGWDDTGANLIDIPYEDGTLIVVPDGTYLIDHNVFYGVKRWGVVALGDNVRFVPREGRCTRAFHFAGDEDPQSRCNEIVFEGIELHQRRDLASGLGINANVHDTMEIHDCRRTGITPNRVTAGPPRGQEIIGLTVNVADGDGFALVKNWIDHCETEVISYPGNAQGISVWDSSYGTVRIEDSSIKNQGEHAIYASKADAVEVVRCELVSNCNTNLRIAGEGSFAKGCRIGYARDAEYTDHARSDGRKATKIVRIEDARDGAAGGRLVDCELFCETDGLAASYLLHVMGNTSGFVVRNSVIRNDSDANGVKIDAEGSGWREIDPPTDEPITFDGTKFTGSSSNAPIESDRAGNVTVKGCSFDMPNAPGPRGL